MQAAPAPRSRLVALVVIRSALRAWASSGMMETVALAGEAT
jgi:hypothetical protein